MGWGKSQKLAGLFKRREEALPSRESLATR